MSGKRAGTRRAAEPAPSRPQGLFGPALGITLALVAWGYLVYAAIEFGSAARDGDGGGWLMLALATLGAAACLFVGLMMISRLAAALGLGGSGTRPPRAPLARREAEADDGRSGTMVDTSSWAHTRPQGTGTRPRIVPSIGAASPAPGPDSPRPSTPTAPQPPRSGGSRASRQAKGPRRDRPAGGRRAAR